MTLRNKKILVTGAGGFIGSHLTEELVNRDAEVTAFVRYNSQNNFRLIEILPDRIKEKLNIVQGDLKDSDAIRNAVKNIDIVFHLGALVGIPYSYIHPQDCVQTNIFGTFNVLTASKECNIEKVIHTSTSEVYGTAQYVPIDEKHPLQGQSPYSASKIGADKIAQSFHLSYDLPIAIIRPFNTYGPRQSARAIIPTLITQALTKKEIMLGSTSPTRDLTFVNDTVDAFIKIAESPNSIGEVINIGSNFEISINDLAQKIINLINTDIKILIDEKRIRPKKSEVGRLWADNSKAKKLLGWKPNISLDDGLKRTIEWFSDHITEYKVGTYMI